MPEPPDLTTNRRRRPTERLNCQAEGPGAPLPGAPCQEGARGSTGLPAGRCHAVTALSPGAFSFRTEGTGTTGRHHTQPAFLSGAAPGPTTAPGGAGSACQHPAEVPVSTQAEVPVSTQAPEVPVHHPDPRGACRHPSPRSAYWSPRHCFQTLLLGTHSPEMPRSPSPRSSHPSPRYRKCLPSNSFRSAGSSPLQTRRRRQAIIKVMKERTLQNGIICPKRWSFIIEGEREFQDKQRLKNFKTIKPALQEMLKCLP